jgi:hypothetical protein
MSKRLEEAISSKQEAIVKQNQYYQKLLEFQQETEKLRKHVYIYNSFRFETTFLD